ncbi:ATP-binding protein [Listeria monocytogenes]|nr:ATP-binding protein [Listeria monocytogenes]EHD0417798.1 ATP-binding protein [Listeria monocytogenes]
MKKFDSLDPQIGFVTKVDGLTCTIAAFDYMNDPTIIHNGKVIKNITVNSFLVINQGFTKIIGKVIYESIIDQQLSTDIAGKLFHDSRYQKNSIVRNINTQIVGYIENKIFVSGSKYIPMIGNLATIPDSNIINQIYINNYSSIFDEKTESISVGNTINENIRINLPINNFFASHIGIFGNTGSGKSNTLHQLYTSLFAKINFDSIANKSIFLIIDFNGEYTGAASFGLIPAQKHVYKLSTQRITDSRLPIKRDFLMDSDIISMLFRATEQTQKPFIKRVISGWNNYESIPDSLANWISSIILKVLQSEPSSILLDFLRDVLSTLIPTFSNEDDLLEKINSIYIFDKNEKKYVYASPSSANNGFIKANGLTSVQREELKIDSIFNYLQLNHRELDFFDEFEIRAKLRIISDIIYHRVDFSYISPIINRIESEKEQWKRVLHVTNEESFVAGNKDKLLHIISLRECNVEIKKMAPLLLAKLTFDNAKKINEKSSFHLIIDEAHNILSSQSSRESESWKDYRLELFEEIIKEGRKFSYFLTISSQRPADISPTILSQAHNFFIHRLVNEKDLAILNNTISTLDRVTRQNIPLLSPGVCIITGTAMAMPITVQVHFNKTKELRPNSDTIDLLELWGE